MWNSCGMIPMESNHWYDASRLGFPIESSIFDPIESISIRSDQIGSNNFKIRSVDPTNFGNFRVFSVKFWKFSLKILQVFWSEIWKTAKLVEFSLLCIKAATLLPNSKNLKKKSGIFGKNWKNFGRNPGSNFGSDWSIGSKIWIEDRIEFEKQVRSGTLV